MVTLYVTFLSFGIKFSRSLGLSCCCGDEFDSRVKKSEEHKVIRRLIHPVTTSHLKWVSIASEALDYRELF